MDNGPENSSCSFGAFDPEFYALSRTLEALKADQNKNSVIVLTTDSDYYKYLKEAIPSPTGLASSQSQARER